MDVGQSWLTSVFEIPGQVGCRACAGDHLGSEGSRCGKWANVNAGLTTIATKMCPI